MEAPLFTVIDRHAEDVRRQHVGGELDALEVETEQAREYVCQRRLADPRDVLDQQVPTGQQAGQRQPKL